MMTPSSRWWWDLSTREFAELDLSGIVAILPVGAVEQHGPHLPVRVDAAINAGIIARVVALAPAELPFLALPALPIGKSNEHIAYPGTLSLPFDLLAKVWFETGEPLRWVAKLTDSKIASVIPDELLDLAFSDGTVSYFAQGDEPYELRPQTPDLLRGLEAGAARRATRHKAIPGADRHLVARARSDGG